MSRWPRASAFAFCTRIKNYKVLHKESKTLGRDILYVGFPMTALDLNNCVGCGRCLGACHCENDVPILPNIGMFASFDPLALDQACVDAALAAKPMPGSQLYENIHKEGFVDHHDHFKNSTPESEWRAQLDHAAKIGLGNREYEIVKL